MNPSNFYQFTKPFDCERSVIKCYNPKNRHDRKETYSEENKEGRWKNYSYEDILSRDKTSLDIFWLRDDSMIDLDNLPEPDVLAQEIVENIEAALESFREVALKLED